LQNKILHTIGKFPKGTSASKLYAAFQIWYIYDYITKLCSPQAEVIQNHENENVSDIGKGKDLHRKYKRCKLGGSQVHDRSSDQAAIVT
jgi:hypothetical protein